MKNFVKKIVLLRRKVLFLKRNDKNNLNETSKCNIRIVESNILLLRKKIVIRDAYF